MAQPAGISRQRCLPFLRENRCTLKTGPTGTNVCDIQLLAVVTEALDQGVFAVVRGRSRLPVL